MRQTMVILEITASMTVVRQAFTLHQPQLHNLWSGDRSLAAV